MNTRNRVRMNVYKGLNPAQRNRIRKDVRADFRAANWTDTAFAKAKQKQAKKYGVSTFVIGLVMNEDYVRCTSRDLNEKFV